MKRPEVLQFDKGNAFFRDLERPPILIERGEGVYLYGGGKRYLDGASGAAVCSLGHGNEEVASALKTQAKTLSFAHMSKFATPPLLELTEKLVTTTPPNLSRVYCVSGGSEANETAIKLARQYHLQRGHEAKHKVISRRVSYHGTTLGVLPLSGQPLRRRAFSPMMLHAPMTAPAYCYRCPFGKTPDGCALECALDLERVILEEGPENVSAFIAEPVSGSSAPGVHPPDPYWKKIRAICDRYDVLLIVDEIMSGAGRSGSWWAIQHSGVQPDLITAAKGISAGYVPIGAVIVSEEIYDTLVETRARFVHGFTYGGNPLACAVGSKVLDILQRDGLVERAQTQGNKLLSLLHQVLDTHPHVGDVRGRGLLLGVEFVADKASKTPFPVEDNIQSKLSQACLMRELYLYQGGGSVDGLRGDHVLIAPPLIVEDEQLEQIVARLSEAIDDVFSKEVR